MHVLQVQRKLCNTDKCHVLQVEGKVTGSFQSGYLAEVAVNGFTYHAMLFSPYLALASPASTYPQMPHDSKLQSEHTNDGSDPITAMSDAGVLGTTASVTKAESVLPQGIPPPPDVGYNVVTDTNLGAA